MNNCGPTLPRGICKRRSWESERGTPLADGDDSTQRYRPDGPIHRTGRCPFAGHQLQLADILQAEFAVAKFRGHVPARNRLLRASANEPPQGDVRRQRLGIREKSILQQLLHQFATDPPQLWTGLRKIRSRGATVALVGPRRGLRLRFPFHFVHPRPQDSRLIHVEGTPPSRRN
jgi:hypothetical protein